MGPTAGERGRIPYFLEWRNDAGARNVVPNTEIMIVNNDERPSANPPLKTTISLRDLIGDTDPQFCLSGSPSTAQKPLAKSIFSRSHAKTLAGEGGVF